jgi:hypothetical protein
MSFFDNMKKGAIEVALKAFDGYQLAVSETQINSLASTITRGSDTPVNISCQPDAIVLSGEARAMGVPLTYSTRLKLESCEISPTRKVLILRRLDNVDLGGKSLATALFARVVKVLLCGLFSIDPARFALDGQTGVNVEKDLITADLDAMGATEIILTAIKTRLPAALIPLLEALPPVWEPPATR